MIIYTVEVYYLMGGTALLGVAVTWEEAVRLAQADNDRHYDPTTLDWTNDVTSLAHRAFSSGTRQASFRSTDAWSAGGSPEYLVYRWEAASTSVKEGGPDESRGPDA